MTADLRELFEQAGRNAPAPTLDPDAIVRRARRTRARRAWMSAAAVAIGAAAVAVVVFAAAGLHQARPLPPAHPSPPSGTTSALDKYPLLSDRDLASWHLGSLPPQEQDGRAPAPLSPCLVDPYRLGAAQIAAASYWGPPRKANEFVLRFSDAPAAHRALLAVWAGFNDCRQPPRDEPVTRPSAASWGTRPLLDESYATQRGVPLGDDGNDSLMYKMHLARQGNVVVIFEDTGVPSVDDRPTSAQVAVLAMVRAIPGYLTTHPAALCALESPLCPQDILNGG